MSALNDANISKCNIKFDLNNLNSPLTVNTADSGSLTFNTYHIAFNRFIIGQRETGPQFLKIVNTIKEIFDKLMSMKSKIMSMGEGLSGGQKFKVGAKIGVTVGLLGAGVAVCDKIKDTLPGWKEEIEDINKNWQNIVKEADTYGKKMIDNKSVIKNELKTKNLLKKHSKNVTNFYQGTPLSAEEKATYDKLNAEKQEKKPIKLSKDPNYLPDDSKEENKVPSRFRATLMEEYDQRFVNLSNYLKDIERARTNFDKTYEKLDKLVGIKSLRSGINNGWGAF